jgi:nucleotide-binding universal stress UspA family protein
MYERILVATDGSPLSDKAVQHALSLAKISGATLIALRVVPRYPRSYLEGGATVDITEIKRIETQWSEQAQAQLASIKAEGKAMGVTVKTSVAKSDLVAESIITAAEKQDADLIVMASHGRKGIKRLLLGSETQHVLTHSGKPVLVLR